VHAGRRRLGGGAGVADGKQGGAVDAEGEAGGGAQHGACEDAEDFGLGGAALEALDHEGFAARRAREEGDARWVEPRAVAEAVDLKEADAGLALDGLDLSEEALAARSAAVSHEQHRVERRRVEADAAPQLGRPRVVVGAPAGAERGDVALELRDDRARVRSAVG